jgi:hypothetical protein
VAVQRFKSFEGVQQLQTSLANRIAGSGELFRVLDRESDPINRDASLIRHLEFSR